MTRATSEPVRDLPVAVVLPEPLASEVTTYVETEAGWQVVPVDGPPRPALVFAEAPVPGRPTVLVADGTVDTQRVRAGLHAGALDVVAWPSERARVLDAARRATEGAVAPGGPPLLCVGGVAGGVGTSTVTLALAALLAWRRRRVLVVGGDDLLVLAGAAPWDGPGTAEVALLDPADAGPEIETLARDVRGVPGLRALGGGAAALRSLGGWPVDVVVADVRCAPVCDLRVARPDVHLATAPDDGAPLLLVGEPPTGRRPRPGRGGVVGSVPLSARVARAALAGRVPADLPGSWLAALSTALRHARGGSAGRRAGIQGRGADVHRAGGRSARTRAGRA